MLITTFLLSLCQEEFICNNYAKLFKHSFIIIIIYFTKESFNRPLFFFFEIFIQFAETTKEAAKKKGGGRKKEKVNAYCIGLAAAEEEKPRSGEEKAQEG